MPSRWQAPNRVRSARRSGPAENLELLHAGLEVVRLRPRIFAAPRSPLTRQPVSSRTRRCAGARYPRGSAPAAPRAPAGRRRGEIAELEAAVRRDDDRPLDHVLQLAHVSGPGVGRQPIQHVLERSRSSPSSRRTASRNGGRGAARPASAFSRGDNDGKDVQAVIEVGAKPLLGDGALEVAIRGRDQPDVHFERLRPADALEFAVLQRAQSFACSSRGRRPRRGSVPWWRARTGRPCA